MKQRVKVRSETMYLPVQLFLSDLEAIYEVLIDGLDRVSIETDDYTFDNLAELKDLHVDSISSLRMVGYKSGWPTIFVFFQSRTVTVRVETDDVQSLGKSAKIHALVRPRRRPIWMWNLVWINLTGIIALNSLGWSIASLTNGATSIAIFLGIVGLVVSVPWLWFSLRRPDNDYVLKPKHEVTSFWRRNQDTIIVAAITTIITFVITFVLARATTPTP